MRKQLEILFIALMLGCGSVQAISLGRNSKKTENPEDIKVQKVIKESESDRKNMKVQKADTKAVELATAPTTKIAISEGQVLSMIDCINIALENSPNVKKAKNEVKVAKSSVNIAKSVYFPKLSAGTGYTVTENKQSNLNRAHGSNTYNANATLSMMIYNFGKANSYIKMQKFNEIAAKFELEDEVIVTCYNVRTNYYGVLAAKAAVDVNKQYVKINEYQYHRTKAFFDEGLKSKIDLVNAEVTLSDSKIALIKAQNTYQSALVKLNNSMYIAYSPEYSIENTETFNFSKNFTNASPFEISDVKLMDKAALGSKEAVLKTFVQKMDVLKDYKFTKFPYTFEECIKIANENRSDLKAFEATFNAMRQSLIYAKRAYFPELNGSAGYSFKNYPEYNNNGANVYVGLDFPVINGMGIKNEIKKAKAELDIAQNNVDLIKQDIYFGVQGAYIDMLQLEKQIPLSAVKVNQTFENLELANGRYEVGLGNFLEVQNANVNYNNAQQQYVELVYNYNVARAKLEAAIEMKMDGVNFDE